MPMENISASKGAKNFTLQQGAAQDKHAGAEDGQITQYFCIHFFEGAVDDKKASISIDL